MFSEPGGRRLRGRQTVDYREPDLRKKLLEKRADIFSPK